jgi:hypothetical protein
MRKRYVLTNAVLWAAAILAAALLKAPHLLSLILLPTLATLSMLAAGPDNRHHRSDIS